MKSSFLPRLNVIMLAVYLVVALFINGNGRVIGLGVTTSTVLTYSLLAIGMGISLLTLIKAPKQWQIPTLSLLVYFAFYF